MNKNKRRGKTGIKETKNHKKVKTREKTIKNNLSPKGRHLSAAHK
jgi:hypothetical protein